MWKLKAVCLISSLVCWGRPASSGPHINVRSWGNQNWHGWFGFGEHRIPCPWEQTCFSFWCHSNFSAVTGFLPKWPGGRVKPQIWTVIQREQSENFEKFESALTTGSPCLKQSLKCVVTKRLSVNVFSKGAFLIRWVNFLAEGCSLPCTAEISRNQCHESGKFKRSWWVQDRQGSWGQGINTPQVSTKRRRFQSLSL